MMQDLVEKDKLKVILFLMEEFYDENVKISKFRTQGVLTGFEDKETYTPAGIEINGISFYLIEGVKIRVDVSYLEVYILGTLMNRISLKEIKQFDCWV